MLVGRSANGGFRTPHGICKISILCQWSLQITEHLQISCMQPGSAKPGTISAYLVSPFSCHCFAVDTVKNKILCRKCLLSETQNI
jgi:hypothetical protein